jgi:hypothetical protein
VFNKAIRGVLVLNEYPRFDVTLTARFAEKMKGDNIDPAIFAEKKIQICEEGYIADFPVNAAMFRLIEPSLDTLQSMGVQKSVIEKLKPLINDQMFTKDDFILRYIKEPLTEKETFLFRAAILKVANVGQLIETYVLTDKSTLISLLGLLQRMVSRRVEKKKLIKLWGESIQIETADGDVVKLGKKTIAELIENYVGLPVNEELLRYSLHELMRMTNRTIKDLHDRLKLKKDVISDIISEQNVGYKVENDEIKRELLGNKPYFWRTASGNTQFIWIKRSLLP